MFQAPDSSKNFSKKEEEVLHFWKSKQIFEKTLEQTEGNDPYIFYDGPPFATGLPHYGHLLAGTLKDVVPRYQTMKGKYVPRRFGWDCHGLPIENIVEKKLSLSGAGSILEYGIDRFNEVCRENVLTYTQQWKRVVERMGRWVDFDHAYKTMDLSYMESVWWVFKQLFDKGLVYKGYKVMPYSWKLGTPLSNFEASENYQEVDDPSLAVAFYDRDEPSLAYLAWTTTPWTLVSNLALSVNPQMTYVKVRLDLESFRETKASWIYGGSVTHLVLAKERLEDVLGQEGYEVIEEFAGSALVGKSYRPLFDFFEERQEQGAFKILSADFVTNQDGTGIVHTAPAFGEDDFQVCQQNGIDLVCPIDSNGNFDSSVGAFSNIHYAKANKLVIHELKAKHQVLWQRTIRHRYPFCWRSDTPLIYRACQTWFINVQKVKEGLIANNHKVHWVPEHIRDGRFGKWLEGARDWAVSRNRFWGTPIPIWESEEGDYLVVGSKQELQDLTGQELQDLHRHFVDQLEIVRDGKVYRRIDAVFDCWFESGSMPYAQNHYPFENKEDVENKHPADFIAEGLDQTRGWFYTLMVLSTALFDRPAFKNVIVNGIILAEDGNKMSKRLQNYPDPMEVIAKYGADALRLYLLRSPVVRADDLCFSEADVELVMRQIVLPWWNSYNFFLTYAHLYGFVPENKDYELSSLDQWILSRLTDLNQKIEDAMELYHLWEAIDPLVEFIDELTNWYIRRSRRRFWEDQDSPDRQAAFHTLYTVLMTLAKLAAPFMPFLTETMYQGLKRTSDLESVHLCSYPRAQEKMFKPQLQEVMRAVKTAVSMGHALRKAHKLKVRQPLKAAKIAVKDRALLAKMHAYTAMICEELNVKEVLWQESDEEILTVIYKLNFKQLGKKLGPLMKLAQKWVIHEMNDELFADLEHKGFIEIPYEDQLLRFERGDLCQEHLVKEGTVAQYQDGMSVGLLTELSEPLILEGRARELINKVNTLRKAQGLQITDRIELILSSQQQEAVQEVLDVYGDMIFEETLTRSVTWIETSEQKELQSCDLNGLTCDYGLIIA